jgi:hypothetical protein
MPQKKPIVGKTSLMKIVDLDVLLCPTIGYGGTIVLLMFYLSLYL